MESDDSPEIPDKGETSDIPGLPSGDIYAKIRRSSDIKEFSWDRHFYFILKKLPRNWQKLLFETSQIASKLRGIPRDRQGFNETDSPNFFGWRKCCWFEFSEEVVPSQRLEKTAGPRVLLWPFPKDRADICCLTKLVPCGSGYTPPHSHPREPSKKL